MWSQQPISPFLGVSLVFPRGTVGSGLLVSHQTMENVVFELTAEENLNPELVVESGRKDDL